jgi:hypothetical protein
MGGGSMLVIDGICIPRFSLGRARERMAEGSVFLRSRAEHDWVYLSLTPKVYTLEDFWEESASVVSSLEEILEGPGG